MTKQSGTLTHALGHRKSVMNAYGHDRHARPDGHDRVLPNCQHEHVRENGHVRVHGYELSQSRGCGGVDVRVNLSLFSPMRGCLANTLAQRMR